MAEGQLKRGQPVPGFPIEFEWDARLEPVIDRQVDVIVEDIERARSAHRLIMYLSCPVSGRGGGFADTNVEIARFTERRLIQEWGNRFWILNPSRYQLESKEGRRLLSLSAKTAGRSLDVLPKPGGGDYMRMWTRVLVEDGGQNIGGRFDAFYFLGPSDVQRYMARGGATNLSVGVEEEFARAFATDPAFRDAFSVKGIVWPLDVGAPSEKEQRELREKWAELRIRFIRFYCVRAGANFSAGSHDEWNILRLLNERRLSLSANVGELLASFWDGRQSDPGGTVTSIAPGYAV